MATKNTTRSAKQRNQLIFLAIGGVVLLALAFLQGPKLWKQVNGSSSSTASAPVTTTTAAGTTGAAATGSPIVAAPTLKGSAVIVKPSGRPGAKTTVAGVAVKPWQVPQANAGQLWTFSRLQAKDPFVQQVNPEGSVSAVPAFANAPTGSRSTGSASASGSAQPATSTRAAPSVSAPTQLPPTFATLEVNGNEVRLKLDQRFPPATKVFKLAGLKPRSAEIMLATGGKLGNAGKVTLKMGDSITLVNSATGKRYTLRLLYTGSEPEVVQKFSTKAK
jgi:hypothetical protein